MICLDNILKHKNAYINAFKNGVVGGQNNVSYPNVDSTSPYYKEINEEQEVSNFAYEVGKVVRSNVQVGSGGGTVSGNYAPIDHNHDNIYAKIIHNHDDRYYTKGYVNSWIDRIINGDLLYDKINANHIQAGSITAGSGIIANGAIGNAHISSVSADKLDTGVVNTSNVIIQGANGNLKLKGNRLQVFEGTGNSQFERVSLGDVNNDGTSYGLRVRGSDGQTILYDENGVYREGITDGSITNDKISDDANIDGGKLNIHSVINNINDNNTGTIHGTKIDIDGTSLNSKIFEIDLKQDEVSQSIENQQAQITQNKENIDLKVSNQKYEEDKVAMESKFTKVESDISMLNDNIALTVKKTELENEIKEVKDFVSTEIGSLTVGGANYVNNSAPRKATVWDVPMWDVTLNGKHRLTYWEDYNDSVQSPNTGYHPHIDLETFNFPCIALINNNAKFNLANRELALKQEIHKADEVLVPTENYILSFDAYADTELFNFHGGLYHKNVESNNYGYHSGRMDIITEAHHVNNWYKRSFSFELHKGIDLSEPVYLVINGHNNPEGKGYIKNVKLEKGYIPSDWTPSQFDIDDSLDDVVDSMNEYVNTSVSDLSSQIDVKLGSITTKVEEVVTETTKLGDTVANQELRLQSAESKVEKNAITNVVKESFYTKDDIDGKGFTTQSQVQQTVDGLEIKFAESGGYNLLYNGDFKNNMESWTQDVTNDFVWSDELSCKNGRGVYSKGALQTTKALRQQNILLDINEDTYTLSYWQYTTPDGIDGTTNPLKNIEVAVGYTDGTWSYHSTHQTNFGVWERKVIKITRPSDKHFQKANVGLLCRDTTKVVYFSQIVFEEGDIAHQWSPNPNEVCDGVTTITKDGIIVSSSGSNTYTQMDDSSFRVEDNNGGTVAEFAETSTIPTLNSGTINAEEIYANNLVTKSNAERTYSVDGSIGVDSPTSTVFGTVQYVLDNFVEDVLDANVKINISNSVQGWSCTSRTGKGEILFYLDDTCIVSSIIYLRGCSNTVRVVGSSTNRKATLKEGITINNCSNFDVGWLTFRGKNLSHSRGSCCVVVTYGSRGFVRVNDFNGVDYGILVDNNSEIWCYNNKGSSVSNYIGISAYTKINMRAKGSDVCPDYTQNMYSDAGHSNLYYISEGATFTKTPSAGWSPTYTPTKKTRTWSFNKIWSDETKRGWSDRQELIQGYCSKYNTGQWTGYLQMRDGMAGIKSTISGSTNLSGRVYVKRKTSSGANTGTCCMYASDGTHIGNKSMARGAGAWFTLSSAVVNKIMNGTITYFYLKNNADNINTYMKMETLGKIEITYTK